MNIINMYIHIGSKPLDVAGATWDFMLHVDTYSMKPQVVTATSSGIAIRLHVFNS